MSPRPCKVSVVCPAFDEEEVLPSFHADLCDVLASLGEDYEPEVVYVDDGSRDGTLPLLRRLADGNPRVQYLSFSRNFGQQAALTAGMQYARGEAIITLDADLQHPPAVIPELLEKWREGYDIVLTYRQEDRRLGYFKRFSSRAFNRVLRCLSDTPVSLAASDYRLLSRRALDSLLRLPETHRFLRGMVNWLGFRTTTVVFSPASRGAGLTKYTVRRMTGLAIDAMLSFSRLPLRLSLATGLAVLLLGLCHGIVSVGRAVLGSAPEPWAYHVLLLAVLLLGGGILCALGVVGEYVGRIYEQVKARPLYLLKEASPELAAAAGLDGRRRTSTRRAPRRTEAARGGYSTSPRKEAD
jgi:glycosyltransferase involved in cell wall biosynthesis